MSTDVPGPGESRRLIFPNSLRYTIFISVLLVAIVVYGIARGDPLAFVIAGVLCVFTLPLAIVTVLSYRQGKRSPLHNGHDAALDSMMPVGPDDSLGDADRNRDMGRQE